MSGVVNPEQQVMLNEIFREQDFAPSRMLALGAKATHKTQFLDIENKYGHEWYPVGEDFSNVMVPDESGLRVAQVFIEPELAEDKVYRKEFAARIHRRGRAWLNAIQFDMLPWDSDSSLPSFMDDIKTETGTAILLQAHSEIMNTHTPKELVKLLGRFAAVDYVLLDSSHGKGVRLEVDRLRPYVDTLHESTKLEHVGIGIAGGLNAQIVAEDLPNITQKYPDLSWDAEAQLHKVDQWGKRPIDMRNASEYVAVSAEVLKKV